MKLEWLRCFHEVAKTTSINKAAQNLYMAQPAVSKIIRQLENESGEILLIRSPYGVQLTEQGEILNRFAQQTLQLYEDYLAEKYSCQQKITSFSGNIDLILPPLLLQTFYQVIKQKMKQHFPSITLKLIEADLDGAKNLFVDNPYTLGLLFLNNYDSSYDLGKDVIIQELFASEIVICASHNSCYALQKNIALSEIDVKNMIAITFSKNGTNILDDDYYFYTTNLDVIQQLLLSDKNLCVSMSRFIAQRKFLPPHFICIPEKSHLTSSVNFAYHRAALEDHIYSASFLKAFRLELSKCLLL